jgi:hypothetical protein
MQRTAAYAWAESSTKRRSMVGGWREPSRQARWHYWFRILQHFEMTKFPQIPLQGVSHAISIEPNW